MTLENRSDIMDPTPLLPFIFGSIPIFLTRSRPARLMAVFFGAASMGLGAYFIWTIHHSSSVLTEVQRITPCIYAALGVSIVSLIATFCLDRQYKAKV